MANRKFSLIFLSHDLTRKVELTLTHRKVRAVVLALLFFFLVTNVVAGLVASFLLNSKENLALQTENSRLRSHISELETRVAGLSDKMTLLNETDKLLRMMADLPVIDKDTREVGVGGGTGIEVVDPDYPEVNSAQWSMDRVEREIELQKASFEEIHDRLSTNAQMLDHTPTLRPVEGGYISSGFGMRRDPFTKRIVGHQGVDISQERGTPVVASAEGEVIYAGRYFNYGNFIVIDHGFGYQTAYGHLSEIDVKQGQYVAKGSMVGRVGSTGRSTSPHLHYEVRIQGRPVDPTDYFFEDVASNFPVVTKQ